MSSVNQPLVIAGRNFRSRLILGHANLLSPKGMRNTGEAAKRIQYHGGSQASNARLCVWRAAMDSHYVGFVVTQ